MDIKKIGYMLMFIGVLGVVIATRMYGHVQMVCVVSSLGLYLTGMGFLAVNKKL